MKLGEEGSWVLLKSRVLRVWNAFEGEKGSVVLGVLNLIGLAAKAWLFRLMDMVRLRLKSLDLSVEEWKCGCVLMREKRWRERDEVGVKDIGEQMFPLDSMQEIGRAHV